METKPPKADPPKRKRRWFQFSLRSLMIVVTLLAVPLGYVGWQKKAVQERKAMLATIKASGGRLMFPPSAPGVTFYAIVNHNGKPVRDCGVVPAIYR